MILIKLFHHIRETILSKLEVVPLPHPTEKMVSYMDSCGESEIKPSTKKHIRHRLESGFGESPHFSSNKKVRLLVIPDNLTMENLASQYVFLKEQLESWDKIHADENHFLNKAALHIRNEVKHLKTDQPWSPQPDLHEGYVNLPKSLTDFQKTLLSPDTAENPCQITETSMVNGTRCHLWHNRWPC